MDRMWKWSLLPEAFNKEMSSIRLKNGKFEKKKKKKYPSKFDPNQARHECVPMLHNQFYPTSKP